MPATAYDEYQLSNQTHITCPHCGKEGICIIGLKPGDQFLLNCDFCHATVSGGVGRPSQLGNPAGQQYHS